MKSLAWYVAVALLYSVVLGYFSTLEQDVWTIAIEALCVLRISCALVAAWDGIKKVIR